MERGRVKAGPACLVCPVRGPPHDRAGAGGARAGPNVLRRLRRGDHGEWFAARRRDLSAAVSGRCVERDALPVQPRVRDTGIGQSGRGRRRSGHRQLAAQPRLRAGRFLLRLDRLGDPAGAARSDRHARRVRPDVPHPRPDDRLGAFAGRHHHRGPDPALPGPVQCRAADVRCAVRRGGHLEHRAGCGVRLPAAGRPVSAGRQHHQPDREPDRGRDSRDHRAADPAGAGPAGPGRCAR